MTSGEYHLIEYASASHFEVKKCHNCLVYYYKIINYKGKVYIYMHTYLYFAKLHEIRHPELTKACPKFITKNVMIGLEFIKQLPLGALRSRAVQQAKEEVAHLDSSTIFALSKSVIY